MSPWLTRDTFSHDLCPLHTGCTCLAPIKKKSFSGVYFSPFVWFFNLSLNKQSQDTRHPHTHTHTHTQHTSYPTVVKSDPKALFLIATTPRCRGRCYAFPWIAPLTFIMLNRRHQVPFFSLWYDSSWDWNPVSRIIGERSNYYANGPVI